MKKISSALFFNLPPQKAFPPESKTNIHLQNARVLIFPYSENRTLAPKKTDKINGKSLLFWHGSLVSSTLCFIPSFRLPGPIGTGVGTRMAPAGTAAGALPQAYRNTPLLSRGIFLKLLTTKTT